jgi:hypothetical protein
LKTKNDKNLIQYFVVLFGDHFSRCKTYNSCTQAATDCVSDALCADGDQLTMATAEQFSSR